MCSTREGLKHRAQMEHLMGWWLGFDTNYRVAWVTLTVQHHGCDTLTELLSKMKVAVPKFFTNYAWKKSSGPLGFRHYIYGLEMPHGKHGWQVHANVLMFLDTPVDAAALEGAVTAPWIHEAAAAGLKTTEKHGVTVRIVGEDHHTPSNVARYVCKEMFIPDMEKEDSTKGRAPFRLLYDSMQGDAKAGGYFKEFTIATYNKGTIRYSTGLPKMEVPDAALTETPREEYSVLLSSRDWTIIRRAKAVDELRKVQKRAFDRGEPRIVRDFLRGLGCDLLPDEPKPKAPRAKPVPVDKFLPDALKGSGRADIEAVERAWIAELLAAHPLDSHLADNCDSFLLYRRWETDSRPMSDPYADVMKSDTIFC